MFKKKKRKQPPISPYLPEEELFPAPSGSFWNLNEDKTVWLSTGTNPYPGLHLDNPRAHNLEFDIDDLWEKMYTRVLRVIVTCSHCQVPQTIDNGTCMRCGAPLPKPTFLGE